MTSCKQCVHYVNRDGVELCSLGMPLEPCEFYEREPGADLESLRARLKPYLKPGASEGTEEARARLKQREREIRESME